MIRIRPTDDLDEIQELDRKVFPYDVVIQGPHLLDSLWWVAEADGEPLGYAGLHISEWRDGLTKGFLVRAGVLPEARGRHLQRRLIRVRVAAARRLGCARVYSYVSVGNIASLRSLIRCGLLPYYTERPGAVTFVHLEKLLTPAAQIP